MIKIPRPGQAVRGSLSGKPIMALFDLLGRRWAMGIIWHLSEKDLNFRELQEKCESISPTILNTRLKELRTAKFIDLQSKGYSLTEEGQHLFKLLKPFKNFALNWEQIIKE